MKPWAAEIAQHIERWTAHCRDLGYKWLPKFGYHFTDVRNAASILGSNLLLSRASAVRNGLMANDNAAHQVIAETPEPHKHFARLYFRPRTPTQYRNEGIIPLSERYQSAHCPVPVFFCFDLLPVLSADDVEFSNGSMGRPEVQHGSSRELFASIPFAKVYHDGPLPSSDKGSYIFHRHAEILIPDQLSLDNLVAVACRSTAERSTLLHLLSAEARRRWTNRIYCVGDALFYRHRCFVDSVTAMDQTLRVRLHNYHAIRHNPMIIRGTERTSGKSWHWEGTVENTDLTLQVPSSAAATVTIVVCDSLAYRAELEFGDDVPF